LEDSFLKYFVTTKTYVLYSKALHFFYLRFYVNAYAIRTITYTSIHH